MEGRKEKGTNLKSLRTSSRLVAPAFVPYLLKENTLVEILNCNTLVSKFVMESIVCVREAIVILSM